MTHATTRGCVAAAVALMALTGTGTARAGTPEFTGYFRLPAFAENDRGGGQVCFDLAGTREKATGRLGNECGTYTELNFGLPVYEADNGIQFNYDVMLAWFQRNAKDAASGNEGSNTTGTIFKQNFASVTGFGGWLEGSELWMGKRYYRRQDIHAMDWYYIGNDAVQGFGIQDIDVGLGKFSAAVLYKDNSDDSSESGRDLRLDWSNIPVNTNGELEFIAIARDADQSDSTPEQAEDGFEFTVQHTQKDLWGGFNKFAVQYGRGAAGGSGLGGQFNFTTDDTETFRIVDHLVIAPNENFSSFFAFVHEINEVGGEEDQWTTLLARPMVHWNKYISSEMEISTSRVKYGTGDLAVGETGKLNKVTLAPLVLRAGTGPWARPELRFFVTWADWNDAANTRAGGNIVDGSDYLANNATSGYTIGAQVEAWW